MVTDGELGRALNAISATLNDQRLESFESDRVESIVSGALAAAGRLTAVADEGADGVRGSLLDGGERVAAVWLEGGVWRVERVRGPVDTPAYVPGSGES